MGQKPRKRKKSWKKMLRDLFISKKKKEKKKKKTERELKMEAAAAAEEDRVKKLKAELNSVLILDDSSRKLPSTSPRYIISLKFLSAWLGFTMYDNGVRPVGCDNISLLNYSPRLKKFTGKEKLLLNVHYRHVNQATWNTFERYYHKSGPTIKCQLSQVEDPTSWTVVNERAAKQMYKDSLLATKETKKKQSRRERKMNKLGSFSKSNTVRASYIDESGCLFNVDVSDVLGLVMKLSEAQQGATSEGGGEGDHILNKRWADAYIKFALGLDLRFPNAADNASLLQEEESIIGKTWKRKQNMVAGRDYISVTAETWKLVCKFLPGSGPEIFESGEAWKIDENFMLRLFMGAVQVPLDSLRSHADSAAVTFFTNPLKRKEIEEKEQLDKKLKEEQKEAEAIALVGGMLGRGVETRRKSAADECKVKHDELMQKEAALVFSMGEMNRVRSVTGRMREREGASEDEIKEEAAGEIQVWWRVTWVRFQKERARTEKEVAYKHWAATKLQSVWKVKRAKARASQLKKEREALKEEMSALKVEAMFRTHLAKKALKKKKHNKELEGAAGTIIRVWRGKVARKDLKIQKDATTKLTKAVRSMLHRRKVNGIRRLLDTVPMRVKIYNCIGVGGEGADDDGGRGSRVSLTGGRMSSLFKNSPLGKKGGPPDPRVYVSGFGGEDMTSLCLTKTSAKRKTYNPIFNETMVVCGKGLGGNGVLSMTVLDHDKISTHRFVGQAIMDLRNILPDWYFAVGNKKSLLCESVSMKDYKLPIPEYDGKGSIKLGNVDKEGSGKITVEFLPLSPSDSHCGYLSISGMSSGYAVGLGGGAGGNVHWETKWAVLMDGKLTVHQSPWRLNDISWSIKGADVEKWEVDSERMPVKEGGGGDSEEGSEVGSGDGIMDVDGGGKGGEGQGVGTTKIHEIVVKLRSKKTPYTIRTGDELFVFKLTKEFQVAKKTGLA